MLKTFEIVSLFLEVRYLRLVNKFYTMKANKQRKKFETTLLELTELITEVEKVVKNE